ncbi:alpha-1,2-mannosidase [Niastella koreensis GR20-10]|uniref:Alpha-1,2-mannosidase n=3 Tax=Niastella koreensis TaxID=354356 RepID=G8TN43_NIAKG|nr:alpha-1,2-mannosidase [Niastella koreensis GR20-10]
MASLLLTTLHGAGQQIKQLASYVNPFIGASTNIDKAGASHGLGKTFPGATTPYGMVQVNPNTITGGDNGSGYSYEHTSIEGFAFTQLSGIGWYGDLGNFLVMPSTGTLKTSAGRPDHQEEGYRSAFDKQSEAASPGYYKVGLSKYKVKAEMTAAPHSGMLRFTFPANNQSRIQIDLARRVGGTSTEQYVRVVDEHTIEGWMKCTPDGGGWGNGEGHADYTVYFYAQFSKPLKQYGVWSAAIPNDWTRKREDIESQRYQQVIAAAATIGIIKQPREQQGKHLGFFTEFATKENEPVLMKAGISFTDVAHAKMNLEHEITGWDFDKVHNSARALWNQALEKIKIEGGTEEEKTVFYTAMYHTMIDPRIVSDVDGAYTGGDGKIHTAKENQTRRTVFSGWDVFRSQMPLQTIINPALVNDLIGSLTDLAGETGRGYFERWELLNAYSGCMIGNPAVSVLADAYAKGIRNYDLTKAYEYARNSCERFGNGDKGWSFSTEPEDKRRNSYGNSPFPISNTLENAYSEWCLSSLAAAMGKKDDAMKYAKRALSYKNVFDASRHWFRPRKEDGSWEEWPAEGRLKQFYGTVESNPYQQGWFVPHDVPGMVQLMGGKDSVIADLLHFFNNTPANLLWNDYYNHANEPVHHVPFLFNRLNVPWLTQEWSRKICARAYHNKVEGLVGNEDVGQMSAWYVLAASGIHPVCPGDTRYEITSPVFAKVEMQLDPNYAKGKTFTVIAKNNNAKNVYIQRAWLNGKPYNKCFIDHAEVAAGGVLELEMGPIPNTHWGVEANDDLVKYANTLQGTASDFSCSYGNTYPTTALPFGMNAWTPQTGKNGDGWKYQYTANTIRGFGQTHQCSPWVNDYAVFTLMPVAGTLVVDENKRAAAFHHENETGRPDYYKVQFDNGITTEITPVERGAAMRFSYPATEEGFLVLDGYTQLSEVNIDAAHRRISGWVNNSRWTPKGFRNYFVLEFDQPFMSFGTWENEKNTILKDSTQKEGKGAGAWLQFPKGAVVQVKIASSYISPQQAATTLQRELGAFTGFDDTRAAAQQVWNKLFHRVLVEGGTEEQKATFYSCLFRANLFSHQFFEYNEQGQPVYYSPYDGAIHDGYMYTDNGFWDTFRSQFPLNTILHPTMEGRYMQALLAAQQQCGWLPAWSFPSETGGMLGNHAISLLTDAWVKGIRSFSADSALKAYYHEATNKGPWGGANGRQGWKDYYQLGYVAYPESQGSTAQTLEYAYDDFCAWQLATYTGNRFYTNVFARQLYNYRNVFDPATNFMRGRLTNGQWATPFDPLDWGGPYTEGNAWHYTWSVFHDVQGLINLMGGEQHFTAKLDSVFSMPNIIKTGSYGTIIHEMKEMQLANMGQYAHGNQPIQHMIYLYNYARQPWKAQAHVRAVMDKLYNATEKGFPGDEDQGGMSSWYVLSALGLYAVCPGTDQYVIGSPLFPKVTITLENGKQFIIEAKNNNGKNVYISHATLNGKEYTHNWITHTDITNGGVLHFDMSNKPATNRGILNADKPFSLTTK